MNEELKKFSPLSEATYYILLSLKDSLHGYGIIKNVEKLSGGRLILLAGTLYGALNTLVSHKLIELIGEDKENKRRKLYQITEEGRVLMRYEISRLGEMYKNGLKEFGD